MKLKQYGRSAMMGILAGTIYGLWAVYANWGHDVAHVARAAATQFVLSFCSTSFLTLMIELVLARARSAPNLVLAAVGPHAGMVTLFITIHTFAGTPNVLRTIAPSAMIGLLFCIAYVAKRSRAPQDDAAAAGASQAPVPSTGHPVPSEL
jgi:hypothetical protein